MPIKCIALTLAIVALASPTHAGTISSTFTSGNTAQHSSGFSATISANVADAGMEAYYAWVLATANAGGFAPVLPAPSCSPQPCTPTPYTLNQALAGRLSATVQADISSVQAYVAAQTAAAALAANPAPVITVTPNQ